MCLSSILINSFPSFVSVSPSRFNLYLCEDLHVINDKNYNNELDGLCTSTAACYLTLEAGIILDTTTPPLYLDGVNASEALTAEQVVQDETKPKLMYYDLDLTERVSMLQTHKP